MKKLFNLKIFLAIYISLLNYARSQELKKLNGTEKYFEKYNETNYKFEQISPKLKQITTNIILKAYFSELQQINRTIYKKIFDSSNQNTKNLDEDLENFEKKVAKIEKLYYKYERTKEILSKFFMTLFMIIMIGFSIFVVVTIIITFIVIKKQKKYYQLQEEITIEQKDIDTKKTNDYNPEILVGKDVGLKSTLRGFVTQGMKKIFPKSN